VLSQIICQNWSGIAEEIQENVKTEVAPSEIFPPFCIFLDALLQKVGPKCALQFNERRL
jgi:hypothetical protein